MTQGIIDHDRHLRLWGREGQDLIEGSSLIIVGANRLGAECAKSASILGIGRISLVDTLKSTGYEKFLDISLGKGSKVKHLAKSIKACLNSKCNITGYNSNISEALLDYVLESHGIDAIIDVSNDPQSQYSCYEFCLERKIAFFSGVADSIQGVLSHYSPLSSYDSSGFSICIPGFEADNQGIIISNILTGILMEEFRKNLFLTNAELFKKVKVCARDGSLTRDDGTKRTYFSDYLKFELQMYKDIIYSIDGYDTREIVKGQSKEKGLQKKRALVLGCGAIGNYVVDTLARLGLQRIDVVDTDKFDKTNLNRQPLAYDGVGMPKSEVLSKKINRIAGREISSPIFGFVGESFQEKKADNSKEILLNKEWFSKHKDNYDIVFGCFDNADARFSMNIYATQLKFNYIDGGAGGSRPNKSRAFIYSPGRTNCMKCLPAITLNEKLIEREKRNRKSDEESRKKRMSENRALYEGVASVQGGASCSAEWVEGSISMSNQISAGLMVGEARKLFSNSYGLPVDSIFYDSQIGKISIPRQELRCRCGDG